MSAVLRGVSCLWSRPSNQHHVTRGWWKHRAHPLSHSLWLIDKIICLNWSAARYGSWFAAYNWCAWQVVASDMHCWLLPDAWLYLADLIPVQWLIALGISRSYCASKGRQIRSSSYLSLRFSSRISRYEQEGILANDVSWDEKVSLTLGTPELWVMSNNWNSVAGHLDTSQVRPSQAFPLITFEWLQFDGLIDSFPVNSIFVPLWQELTCCSCHLMWWGSRWDVTATFFLIKGSKLCFPPIRFYFLVKKSPEIRGILPGSLPQHCRAFPIAVTEEDTTDLRAISSSETQLSTCIVSTYELLKILHYWVAVIINGLPPERIAVKLTVVKWNWKLLVIHRASPRIHAYCIYNAVLTQFRNIDAWDRCRDLTPSLDRI